MFHVHMSLIDIQLCTLSVTLPW